MRKEKMEHKIKKSVKDEARGTEERISTTSENNVYNTLRETVEYFHLFINAEMLMIAARTHAV